MPEDRAGHERETIEASLRSMGLDYVDLWLVHWPPSGEARPDTWEQFIAVRERGLTRLLVEGGATVHAAFLDRSLADRLEIFTAPITLGAAGHSAIDALAALALDEAPKFTRTLLRKFGPDVLESYRRKA